jgi:hypothetical protein
MQDSLSCGITATTEVLKKTGMLQMRPPTSQFPHWAALICASASPQQYQHPLLCHRNQLPVLMETIYKKVRFSVFIKKSNVAGLSLLFWATSCVPAAEKFRLLQNSSYRTEQLVQGHRGIGKAHHGHCSSSLIKKREV